MTCIYIDPGHGGSDPGAVGSQSKEKDINLAVAKLVSAGLQARGIDAPLTRTGDTRLSESANTDLNLRVLAANNRKADYFISIHCNANAGPSGTGTETYVYGYGGKAEKLAHSVQSEVVKAIGLANRGVKTGNFAVIRDTRMPAILIEMGFINNPSDEAILLSRQHDFAQAIVNGVLGYLGMQKEEGAIVEKEISVERARRIIIDKAGLSPETVQYLWSYRYGDELLKKLAAAIE